MLFGIDSYGRVKISLCYHHIKHFLLLLCTQLHRKCKQTSKHALGLVAMEVCPRAVTREALVLVKYNIKRIILHELAKCKSLSITKGPVFLFPSTHTFMSFRILAHSLVFCTQKAMEGAIHVLGNNSY